MSYLHDVKMDVVEHIKHSDEKNPNRPKGRGSKSYGNDAYGYWYDMLFNEDGVTGNGSGSYFFSSYKAEQRLKEASRSEFSHLVDYLNGMGSVDSEYEEYALSMLCGYYKSGSDFDIELSHEIYLCANDIVNEMDVASIMSDAGIYGDNDDYTEIRERLEEMQENGESHQDIYEYLCEVKGILNKAAPFGFIEKYDILQESNNDLIDKLTNPEWVDCVMRLSYLSEAIEEALEELKPVRKERTVSGQRTPIKRFGKATKKTEKYYGVPRGTVKAELSEYKGWKAFYSYGTLACVLDPDGVIQYMYSSEPSATTLRHIKDFTNQFGRKVIASVKDTRTYKKEDPTIFTGDRVPDDVWEEFNG